MKKLIHLTAVLSALFGTVISARADAIAVPTVYGVHSGWAIVLVLMVIAAVLILLRRFRKK